MFFPDINEIKEDGDMCAELSRRFSINPLFWTETLTESNGIFICEDCPVPSIPVNEIKSSMRMNDAETSQVCT